MVGPARDDKAAIFTWVCLLAISVFFFLIASPYIWYEISPLMPLAAGYFFVTTIVFLILTTITEPGIIPRKSVLEKMGVK
jgi:palmitoyltransferase ZDHHC9/14/18